MLPAKDGNEPRLAAWLIRMSLPPAERDALLGDLAEELADRVEHGRRWYWRQVPGCVLHGLVLRRQSRVRLRGHEPRKESPMKSLAQDIRYGVRSIRRNPSFSLLVAATLALGIAANTLVFSVVDGVVLHPFPFPDAGRLVGVGTGYPKLNADLGFFENLSSPEYLDIAQQSTSLEHVVAWDMGNRQVTFGDVTENLFSAFWWGDAFPTLGVQPVMGRGFTPGELERGDRVAILSHRVWRDRFGADANLVGGRILMNGEPWTVIGIMPEGTLIYGTDLWIPMGVPASRFPRNRRQFQVIARLRDGVTLSQANAELATIAGRVETEYGRQFEEYTGWQIQAMTWNDVNVRSLKPAALILLGAVMFVLLLVCANVANLLLARGSGRHREIAVRAALGAGRPRILGQLLAESVVLAVAGGAIGAFLGWFAVRGVSHVLSAFPLPVPGEVSVNGRVLLFTAVVSVCAGLVFGLVPALHAARFDLQRALQAESQAVAGSRSRLRLQRAFVVVEVALALAIVAGSGLLVNSFLHLRRVEPGFDPASVLTMRLTLASGRYDATAIEPFFQQLRERVGAIPGVVSVATTSQYPPLTFSRSQFSIEGTAVADENRLPVALTTLASPGYFETLRIPVLRGRSFTGADRADGQWVVVVNEAAAHEFFGDNAIGQRIRVGQSPWMEIVGVVESTKNRGMDQPAAPELFGSTLQLSGLNNQMYLVIRTRGTPRGLLPAVREAVRSIDAEQPIYQIRTLEQAIAGTQATQRVSMITLTLFGLFALVLAGIGVYGVVAYGVSQRRREIGLRMALGAEGSQLRGMVVRQALVPVAIGVVIGLAGALAIGRLMASMLFEVGGADPVALSAAALVLGTAAFLASWLPARRASNLDPIRALRLD
jgi:putative ABC transport system permease protein